MEWLVPAGLAIVAIGIAILAIGILLAALKSKAKVEGGFIFWIGPIPIAGFATRKEFFYFLIGISIAMFILFFFLRKLI